MALSIAWYPSDGAQKQFAVPFSFLSRDHINVFKEDSLCAFRWLNDATIELIGEPLEAGKQIKIQRLTPRDHRLVDFVDGNILTERDLDAAHLQLLFLIQESLDQVADGVMDGGLIVNNPGGGYITPEYVQETLAAAVENSPDLASLMDRVDDLGLDTALLAQQVQDHTVSIQTQQTAIDGISAQYTVKIDNNGYVTGFGLASVPVNGIPYSTFTILADAFKVVTPGVTPRVPFMVNAQGVWIDTAMIASASITNAHITNLSAAKLTLGTLDTARIAAGSLTANLIRADEIFTQRLFLGNNKLILDGASVNLRVEDGGIERVRIGKLADNSYGIIIKDATGATVFGSSGVPWTFVNGRPTNLGALDSTANTKLGGIATGATVGATIGTNLSGQFTAANATTFIANGAIGAAQIGDAQITSAKIADASVTAAKIVDAQITNAKIANAAIDNLKLSDLSVSTLKIQGNAVTVPASMGCGGTTNTTETFLGAISVTPGVAATVFISGLARGYANGGPFTSGQAVVRLYASVDYGAWFLWDTLIWTGTQETESVSGRTEATPNAISLLTGVSTRLEMHAYGYVSGNAAVQGVNLYMQACKR